MSTWASPIVLPPAPEPGTAAPALTDWQEQVPVFADMALCEQDPEHHAEGDVLTHTQMVCSELVADPAYAALSPTRREELWWAAVLHDCGKPATTRLEDGRLRSPGHARAGGVIARELLWRAGLDPERRERVCALVHWHMTPYHLLDRDDPTRIAAAISLTCIADDLALLGACDSRGRIGRDLERLGETVGLFGEFCAELGCAQGPYPFASDHHRYSYFQHEDRYIDYPPFDDTAGELTMLVGLPGAGKDHWAAAEGLPVVSLDDLRRERGGRRGDSTAEGQMLRHSRELVREHLRAGERFIFNATNLSRQQRQPVLGLAADYNARVRLVCVEARPEDLARQNRDREHPVPEEVIGSLLRRWEAPTLADAHTLQMVLSGAS